MRESRLSLKALVLSKIGQEAGTKCRIFPVTSKSQVNRKERPELVPGLLVCMPGLSGTLGPHGARRDLL
jgi:hypothetical protein